MERRTRLKTAITVKILAAALILSPLAATWAESLVQSLPITAILTALPFSSIIMYGWAVFCGVLLLTVQRPLSIYVLYAFSLAAAGYGVFALIQTGHWHAMVPAAINCALFVFVYIRFYRGPLKHPFLTENWRGFRRNLRTSTEINVIVNDRKLVTDNISASGLRVHWPDCESDVGDEVEISFLLHSKPVILPGGITRIDSDTVSIAFRHESSV